MELIKEFLVKYLELCLKYNVEVGGCGCCGSPYLKYNNDTFVKIDFIDIDNINVNNIEKVLYFDLNNCLYKIDLEGNMTNVYHNIEE